jgi:hypothetical protein
MLDNEILIKLKPDQEGSQRSQANIIEESDDEEEYEIYFGEVMKAYEIYFPHNNF